MVYGATQVVEALAPSAAGKDVFEFGCGTGRNLARLEAAGAASVSGCDLSEGMLTQARARSARANVFRHDMTEPLPVPDESVDLALCCLALEHVEALRAPLGEARRVLRPGGALHLIEIHPFLSLGGLAAHFADGDEEVQMPTVAHRFADYLNAFAAEALEVRRCTEWRPRDFAPPVPPKVLKRGPDRPLLVEFWLQKRR
jgi:malonyl-CoA O-methyltransferase